MSSSGSLLLLASVWSVHGYADIIDASTPNEFNSAAITCSGNGDCKIICDELNSCYAATITCPAHFLCDIECLADASCQNAQITCPYGEACSLHCGSDVDDDGDGGRNACRGSTVNAQFASQFTLDGCSDQLSCNGMNLYLPPNDGDPRAIINGGGTLASVNSEPLNLYAIFGWLDLSIRDYQGTWADHHHTVMHCLPDYSSSCTLADDSWTCYNPDDVCNVPPTSPPTTSPTAAPSPNPTFNPTLNPSTNPTTDPSAFPTRSPSTLPTAKPTLAPTTSPTLTPSAEPTVTPPHSLTSSTTSFGLYLYEDTQPLNHVDILWLVTSLLLSLLCIILVILTYYVFKSRYKGPEDYAPPEVVKRMHSQSLRNSPSNSIQQIHRKHTGSSHSNNLNMVMAEDLNQSHDHLGAGTLNSTLNLQLNAMNNNSNHSSTRYPFHLPPPQQRRTTTTTTASAGGGGVGVGMAASAAHDRQHSVHPHISDDDTGTNSMYFMSPREEGSDVFVPRHSTHSNLNINPQQLVTTNGHTLSPQHDHHRSSTTRSPQLQALHHSPQQHTLYSNGNLNRLHQQSVTTTMPSMPYWNKLSYHSQSVPPHGNTTATIRTGGTVPSHHGLPNNGMPSSLSSTVQYPMDPHPHRRVVYGRHPVRFSGDSTGMLQLVIDHDDDDKSKDVDQIEISQMSATSGYKVTPQLDPVQPLAEDPNSKPTLFMITNADGDIVAEHGTGNKRKSSSANRCKDRGNGTGNGNDHRNGLHLQSPMQKVRGRHMVNESALSSQIPPTRCLSPLSTVTATSIPIPPPTEVTERSLQSCDDRNDDEKEEMTTTKGRESMDKVPAMKMKVKSKNPKHSKNTKNAMKKVSPNKGRSDTLKILDRQRIRGGLTKLNQSDDESIDETTTYVETVGTTNGEEMENEMDDDHQRESQPLRRQETKLDAQTLERVRMRIMTGNKGGNKGNDRKQKEMKQQKQAKPLRVYRRPRDDSDEYSNLVQRAKVQSETQRLMKRGGDDGNESDDSLGTESEEEEVTTSSEMDEFDDSMQSEANSKRGRAHQKMSTMIRHPTASRLDGLKDIEQRSSDTEFEEIDEERPLQFGSHHEKGCSVSGRGGVMSPVSALSQIKSRFSQLSDMSAAPIKSAHLVDSSVDIQGLINV